MGDLTLIYENFADQGVFVSGYGSWLSALPLTNMQDADIQKVSRSTDAQESSTRFRHDLGTQQEVGGIAFGPCNISPGASWRARGYSDVDFTTVAYDTGIQTVTGDVIDWTDTDEYLPWENPGFWLGIEDFENFLELPLFLFHVVPDADIASTTCQYWQIEIFDTGNADGHIDIGRLLIGHSWHPSNNYTENNSYGINPLTDIDESLGGKRTYWERGLRRTWQATLQNLSESEMFDEAARMMLRSQISRQVFIVPDPDDTQFGRRRNFLATMKEMPALQQLLVSRGSTVVSFEEVL